MVEGSGGFDRRLCIVSELDQVLTGIRKGDEEACDRARRWLIDLAEHGSSCTIATMVCGCLHQIEAALEYVRDIEKE